MASGAPGPGDGEPGKSAPGARHHSRVPGPADPGRGTPGRAVPGTPDAPSDAGGPRTTKDAGAWLLIAALGFLAGQVASAVLVEVVAAGTGHLADVSKLVV